MRLRIAAIAACVCLLVRVAPVLGQSSVMTRPLSASVQRTFISQDRQIQMLILWRGAPGWFFAPEHSQGGGSGTIVSGMVEYGPVRLDYSYDRSQRVLKIGDREVPLSAGQNVVLVDEVERTGDRVVKTLAMDFRFESPNPTLASIIGPSTDVVAFLRCEVPGPQPLVQARINAMVCDDLKFR